ncbi:hypothetical protein [Micromonospora rubida]
MSLLIPLWVPMAVAVLGVLGTLAASIVTQVLTRRRDDRRWSLEREERARQWHREDAARWLADRRAAYTELLVVLHEQDRVLEAVRRRRAQALPLDGPVSARLTALSDPFDRAWHAVELLAPGEVTRIAGELTRELRDEGDQVLGRLTGPPAEPAPGDRQERFAALGAAMRQDLGVHIREPDPKAQHKGTKPDC